MERHRCAAKRIEELFEELGEQMIDELDQNRVCDGDCIVDSLFVGC